MSGPSDPERLDHLDVITFGCRLNTYESQVMKREGKKLALATQCKCTTSFNVKS